jgi:hypothetical protein
MKVVSRRLRPERRERGYVAVFTALILTVLLMAVGLVVDLAYWYSRSTTIQRAADAAALAGVTAAPKFSDELTRANESLANNGFKDGLNGIDVDVANVPGFANRLQVTVTDRQVPGFFTRMFGRSPIIQRSSSAQYLQNISLGSALNAIGTGDLDNMTPTAGQRQDFWLAVSGFCTAKEDGDRLMSFADGNRKQAAIDYVCDDTSWGHPDLTNAHRNADYDPSGYTYFMSVPCSTGVEVCPAETLGNDVTVEIFDPDYDPTSGGPLDTRLDRRAFAASNHPDWYWTQLITTYQVFMPDTTPDDLTDDVPVTNGKRTYFSGSAYTRLWDPLVTLPAGSPRGRYRIQVHTEANERNSFGHNVFALRARVGATFTPCSTIPGSPGFTLGALCPSIAGDESMSVYANKAAGVAEMYLARLAPAEEYQGKRIRILLWDPGEGAEKIEILKPGDPNPVEFRIRTWDPGLRDLSTGDLLKDRALGWDSVVKDDELVVSGNTAVTGTYLGVTYPVWAASSRYSPSRFNDRMVALEITVPRDYGRDAAGNPIPVPDDGWWKIRYTSATGEVRDRTTWSVTLAGDPVHLVDQTP